MTPLTFDNDTIRAAFSDAYDGQLGDDERVAFDTHLARNSSAADDYASFVDALTLLASERQRAVPDEHVASVLAAVSTGVAHAPSHARWNVWTHAAAAVLGAAACLAAVVVLETDDAPSMENTHVVEAEEPVVTPTPVEVATAAPIAVSDEAPVVEIVEVAPPSADAAEADEAAASVELAPAAPLIDLRIDGRRLAATWAGLRDDIADLLADARELTLAPVAVPVETVPVEVVPAEPTPAPVLIADSAPTPFEWPAALRTTSVPRQIDEPGPAVVSRPVATPIAAVVSHSTPARDGVRLLAIDDQVSALRSRGRLVDVVPTLIAHLSDDDDPATTMAADQLAEIAEQIAANPRLAQRLRTPRYVEPEADSWFEGWFEDEPEETITHDGTTSSYWSAWLVANAEILAALDNAGEA